METSSVDWIVCLAIIKGRNPQLFRHADIYGLVPHKLRGYVANNKYLFHQLKPVLNIVGVDVSPVVGHSLVMDITLQEFTKWYVPRHFKLFQYAIESDQEGWQLYQTFQKFNFLFAIYGAGVSMSLLVDKLYLKFMWKYIPHEPSQLSRFQDCMQDHFKELAVVVNVQSSIALQLEILCIVESLVHAYIIKFDITQNKKSFAAAYYELFRARRKTISNKYINIFWKMLDNSPDKAGKPHLFTLICCNIFVLLKRIDWYEEERLQQLRRNILASLLVLANRDLVAAFRLLRMQRKYTPEGN